MTHPAPHPGQRGYALLIVLWTVALLALLGTQLVLSGRGDAQLARNLVVAAELQAAADGAVQQAVFGMLLPSPQRWQPDGATHTVRIGSVAVTVRLDSEAGKVNPNLASADLLSALLQQVGAPPATAASVAAAIVDWRSTGQPAGTAGLGAAQYAAAGRDYAPPGKPFRSIDEVGLVLGMTPALLASLRPHLTVWTNTDPNGSTQDPVVAAALGHPPPPTVGDIGAYVATVTIRAFDANGGAFTERAVVRIQPLPGRRPYQILDLRRNAHEAGGAPIT